MEIHQRGAEDPTVVALTQTNWLIVVETPPTPDIIQSWDLGKGESSVLTWAYTHPDTEAIVDDLAARRCAAVLGIPVRGTLGLVLTCFATWQNSSSTTDSSEFTLFGNVSL